MWLTFGRVADSVIDMFCSLCFEGRDLDQFMVKAFFLRRYLLMHK